MSELYNSGRTQQMELFTSNLPSKPYCSDDLTYGLKIRNVEHALRQPYIQPNHVNSKLWLVFDIDRPTCVHEITDDLNLPLPHFFVQNPDNQHAHVYYGLETAVHLNKHSSLAPIRFAAAVDCAYTIALDADSQYCGLIGKNPSHNRWRTYNVSAEQYDLTYLTEFVDLKPYGDRRKMLPETGLGRNFNLFNRLRFWSYKAIRQGWPEFEQWYRACHDRAMMYNRIDNPLPYGEVRHTAKSVAKWTHRNMSQQGFSDLQAHRGSLKGQKVRDEKLGRAIELLEAGWSQRMIAAELETTQQTIGNWLRASKVTKSHIR